ncbi:PREDICTED: LYR motif-containing protein 4 [Wasmannia auropunctata]|uniref:LYR motif-containing protein 4 n=1 Tax=Wasmannia auropunctata TaxID=64793 RepID=UPI0005EFFFDF|nr:PREDICTED: LYR motif-containing protein 4 [Wasmannia auropunctata]
MSLSRDAILSLYRNLIRESKKWSSYNYRMYALRKVRHEFKENKALEDEEKVRQCYGKGQEALSMIKKQAILGNLYSTRPLVIETKSKLHSTIK